MEAHGNLCYCLYIIEAVRKSRLQT